MKRFFLFIATVLVASMSFAQPMPVISELRESYDPMDVMSMVNDTTLTIDVPIGSSDKVEMTININADNNVPRMNSTMFTYHLTGDNQYVLGDRTQSVVTLTQFMTILDNYTDTKIKNDKFYAQDTDGKTYKINIKRIDGIYHLYLCGNDYTKADFEKIREDIYNSGNVMGRFTATDVDAEIAKLMNNEPNTLFPIGVPGVMMSPMRRGGMHRPIMMMRPFVPNMQTRIPMQMTPTSPVPNYLPMDRRYN